MPSTVAVLKRWIDLDAALTGGLVKVGLFAKSHRVDVKTVKRDLADLQALGQTILTDPTPVDVDGRTEVLFIRRYAEGTRPLFTVNLSDD